MSIKASASVTLSSYRDTEAVTRYYKLVSSTASAPSKPTTNPPSGWDDTEPSYTNGSTNTLYFCDLTEFSDGTWAYSAVSKSSSYEAAKEAYNKAQNAQDTANSANGKIDNLEVGGRNLLLDSEIGDISKSLLEGSTAFRNPAAPDLDEIPCYNMSGPAYIKVNFPSLTVRNTYTFSLDCARHVGGSPQPVYITINGVSINAGNATAGTWTNFSVTFNATSASTHALVRVNTADGSNNNYVGYTRRFKLEKGNKATDWTPAPEDTEAKIESVSNDLAQANADIEMLNGRITSTASEVSALGTRTSTLEQTASDFTVRFTNDEKDIKDAAKVATNYLNFNGAGLTIGNLTDTTLGNNVFIDSDSVDIRSGTTVLASYQANKVELGKNSRNSVIDLCNGVAQFYNYNEDTFGVDYNRLVIESKDAINLITDSLFEAKTSVTHENYTYSSSIALQSYIPWVDTSEGYLELRTETYNESSGSRLQSYLTMMNAICGIHTTNGDNEAYIGLAGTLGQIDIGASASVNVKGQLRLSDNNSFVFHYSDDSVILRNDGSDFYLLHGSGSSPTDTYDTLRPFAFNFETGKVTIGNDLTVGGNIVTTGTLNFTQYSKGFSCTTTFGHTGIVTVSSGAGLYLYTYKTGVSGWDSSLCLANENGVNLVPKTGGGFSGNISAPIMYATNRIEAGRVLSKGTYTNTTTGAANVAITSGHYLVRSTSSSERYKHDINPISQYRDILNIPVKEYIYNLDYVSEDDQRYNKVIPGFIAEDVERFYPIAAEYANGLVEDWNHRMILPPMLAVLEDHDKEIQNMRKEISNLEAIIEQSGIKINGCS